MDSERIKRMLDACYQAKRIRDMLPPLPQGVTLRIFTIWIQSVALESSGHSVKVSDISDALELPRPGVTRTVKEMAAKGYLRKYASEEDGRVTYIADGTDTSSCSRKYMSNFLPHLHLTWTVFLEKRQSGMIRTIDVLSGYAERGIRREIRDFTQEIF